MNTIDRAVKQLEKEARNSEHGYVYGLMSIADDNNRRTIERRTARLLLMMDRAEWMKELGEESTEDGGKGSGNWGHAGRKGEVGGSLPEGGKSGSQMVVGGGKHFRKYNKETEKYESRFTKEERAMLGAMLQIRDIDKVVQMASELDSSKNPEEIRAKMMELRDAMNEHGVDLYNFGGFENHKPIQIGKSKGGGIDIDVPDEEVDSTLEKLEKEAEEQSKKLEELKKKKEENEKKKAEEAKKKAEAEEKAKAEQKAKEEAEKKAKEEAEAKAKAEAEQKAKEEAEAKAEEEAKQKAKKAIEEAEEQKKKEQEELLQKRVDYFLSDEKKGYTKIYKDVIDDSKIDGNLYSDCGLFDQKEIDDMIASTYVANTTMLVHEDDGSSHYSYDDKCNKVRENMDKIDGAKEDFIADSAHDSKAYVSQCRLMYKMMEMGTEDGDGKFVLELAKGLNDNLKKKEALLEKANPDAKKQYDTYGEAKMHKMMMESEKLQKLIDSDGNLNEDAVKEMIEKGDVDSAKLLATYLINENAATCRALNEEMNKAKYAKEYESSKEESSTKAKADKAKKIDELSKSDDELERKLADAMKRNSEVDPYETIGAWQDEEALYEDRDKIAKDINDSYGGLVNPRGEWEERLESRKAVQRAQNDIAEREYQERIAKLNSEHENDNIGAFAEMLEKEFKIDMKPQEIYDFYGTSNTSEVIKTFFGLLKENGCFTPYKQDSYNHSSLYDESEETKANCVQSYTGCDRETANKISYGLTQFTGSANGIHKSENDEYISADSVRDTVIYRGLKLFGKNKDKYAEVGATFDSPKSWNMSWSTSISKAIEFSGGSTPTVMVCVGNKTSAPIKAYSEFPSEEEVLSHSKAQWTVLFGKKVDGITYLYCVEKNKVL